MKNNSIIETLFNQYNPKNNEERRNALKQIVQEIALVGFFRSGFFEQAAFYGGSALRIFHSLERFSEDLDFSLLEKDLNFDLQNYLGIVENELSAFGFEMKIEKKEKIKNTAIQSAFIKGETVVQLVKIASIQPPISGIPSNEIIKIKIEVDTDPPSGAHYEVKHRLNPILHSVKLYDLPSLFAGKLHALLCRSWKERVKGRDFYDYIWYLKQNVPVNIFHLEQRMRQTKHWQKERAMNLNDLQSLIAERVSQINFEEAKKDIMPFISNTEELSFWSPGFFIQISKDNLQSE